MCHNARIKNISNENMSTIEVQAHNIRCEETHYDDTNEQDRNLAARLCEKTSLRYFKVKTMQQCYVKTWRFLPSEQRAVKHIQRIKLNHTDSVVIRLTLKITT